MTKEQYKNLLDLCEALEGDHYEQGQGVLKSKDKKYCCLGVAIDLINPSSWELKKTHSGAITYFHPLGSDCSDGTEWHEQDKFFYLSLEGMLNYGLEAEDCKKLALMNDQGKSFAEIAQYIRENILTRYAGDC